MAAPTKASPGVPLPSGCRGSSAAMDAAEIARCCLQMEKSRADGDHGSVLALLGDLDTSRLTAEQLETTDAVRALYGLLKTCGHGGVKMAAKRLLSKWKKQYSKDVGRRGPEPPGSSSPQDEGAAGEAEEDPSSGSAQAGEDEKAGAPSPLAKDGLQTTQSASTSSDFPSVRPKCVQLLLAALRPEPPDREQAADLAACVEQQVHRLHAASQLKYKACVRSKVANLRNPRNGHLRRGLLSGSLSPETFAGMSAEEMAGAELRRLRERYSASGVSERQLPGPPEGTRTRKIRCERCGGRECSVTQVSRGALFLPAWVRRGGADEDAMTFVTCGGCGQQWYHSGWVCL